MQYITGNKFKLMSNFILDENGFRKNKEFNKDQVPIYFIKTDFLDFFIKSFKPEKKFKIITHNSDFEISQKYDLLLNDPLLVSWFGQNINYKHPKLISIPIGIANEIWSHGDEKILKKVCEKNLQKEKLIYCNFDINTNFFERKKCVQSMVKNKLLMSDRKNFEGYLDDLSKSFFSLSPNGNGIDCHKLWESLYLKTIPVVTKSINVDFYKNLPILIIDSWEDLDVSLLTEDLYKKIMSGFDINKISFKNYEEKILLW